MNEDGNIFVNGNRALFLEPIQATSLGCYGLINQLIIDCIENKHYDHEKYTTVMDEVIKFINLHYYNGSDYDTPFWNMAQQGAREVLGGINPAKYDWKYVIDWTPQFRQKMFESFL